MTVGNLPNKTYDDLHDSEAYNAKLFHPDYS
ncbi:hypothetical protein SAMN05421827_11834 [Pedobacter terrae]|uniref:Uncharacterized protein n=1 Tax=Pedobacter terrae TaxID=405671 RepID=A0A1G8A7V2_9SPHI|nr:hypothetical protein SAMN05421827_11834 [Pedobacter terrae]